MRNELVDSSRTLLLGFDFQDAIGSESNGEMHDACESRYHLTIRRDSVRVVK